MLSDPDGPLIYIIIFILLLLSALFAGSESAFSSLNKHRMIVLSDDGNKRAKLVLKILDRFDTTIITTLIAINVCHVVLSVLTTLLTINLVGEVTGSILSTIITTIVVFFFAEILPKNIATLNADKWALLFSRFIYFFIIILTPISIIFNTLLKGTKKAFNLEEDEDVFDEDDFTDVIEQVEDEGMLDSEESDIIQAAIEFGDIKVKEVYTPREKIVAFNIKDDKKKLDKMLDDITYSRLPVYDSSLDNIIGILHVRTYLKERLTKRYFNIKDILSKPYYVKTESMIDDIFTGMQENKTQLAIVKGKQNKTIGIITVKDILEELVEDIDDTIDESRGDDNA